MPFLDDLKRLDAARVRPVPLLDVGHWLVTLDGDPVARAIYHRHYSHRPYADGRDPALFVGPGGKLVLMAPDESALFVWRLFIDDADDGTGKRQSGVCCAVFRNEGSAKSSEMILAAEPFASRKWPAERRFYTYVNAEKVRRKRDPGRCFVRAGWRRCGETRGGLLILEKTSAALDALSTGGV